MKLLVNEGLTQTDWDTSLLSHPESHFLQSWAWGDFQINLGHSIWRLAVEDNGEIIAQLLVIKQSLGLGQHILYSPRGNLSPKHSALSEAKPASDLLLTAIQDIASKENCIFFRIDPPVAENDIATTTLYRQLGFIPNPSKPIQPKHNQVISLEGGLDRVLAKAKSKTRYNISVAKRHELHTNTSATENTITSFLTLIRETATRQGFTPHSQSYLEKQVRFLTNRDMADIVTVSSKDGRALSSLFIVYFNRVATYLHGASSSQDRSLMAPYLAHAKAIEQAIAKGMSHYDMGGIQLSTTHAWAGITRFKQSFGGEVVSFVGTLELPVISWKYQLYRLLNKLR